MKHNKKNTKRNPVIDEAEERQRMLTGVASIMPPICPQTIPTQMSIESNQKDLTELDSPEISSKIFLQCNLIIQDYELLHNIDDAIFSLIQDENSVIRTRHAAFVKLILLIAIMKNPNSRTEVGQILTQLLSKNIISMKSVIQGINAVFVKWKEGYLVGRGIPFFTYISAIIAPILISRTSSFYFNNLMDASLCIRLNYSAILLNEILQTILCPENPKNESEHITDVFWMYNKWRMSKYVTLDLFMPSTSIMKYFKNDRTGIFIMCAVLCDKLKKTENNNKLFDEMIPWINNNIKDEITKCPYFVRTLTIAITIVRFKPSSPFRDLFNVCHEKLMTTHILRGHTIPVHEIQAREFQCLYGIHLVASALDHPKGMILILFNRLYQGNVISKKAFFIWRNMTTGKSLIGLETFFQGLEMEDFDEKETAKVDYN